MKNIVAVSVLLVVGYFIWNQWGDSFFSSQPEERVIWSDDGVDHKEKRAWIKKVELVSETCSKVSFRVSYFNTGKTDGYIRFNTSSSPSLEGARGDHSITLKQGDGSGIFQEWIINEITGWRN